MAGIEELLREQDRVLRERRAKELRRIENRRRQGVSTWDDDARAFRLRQQMADEEFEEREEQEEVRRAVDKVHSS